MTASLVLPGRAEPLRAVAEVFRDAGLGSIGETGGLGPLTDLVVDPSVTDVLVNGPAEVWVDRGIGLQPVPGARFQDADDLRRFAVRLAAACGRRR